MARIDQSNGHWKLMHRDVLPFFKPWKEHVGPRDVINGRGGESIHVVHFAKQHSILPC